VFWVFVGSLADGSLVDGNIHFIIILIIRIGGWLVGITYT
jgi:hypothetical protein